MGGIDDDEEEDEFVDEESLLTEEDLLAPAAPPGNRFWGRKPLSVFRPDHKCVHFPSIFWFDFFVKSNFLV